MKKVSKRCDKCGTTSLVLPRERRCKRQMFGSGSYACWGRLVRPEKPKVVRTPQQQATADMARSEKVLDDKLQQLTRLVTSIREWRRKVAYYARRAVLTDADLDAMRTARIERAAKRRQTRRSIALKGNIPQD